LQYTADIRFDNSLKVFLNEKNALSTVNHSLFSIFLYIYKAKTVTIVNRSFVIKLYLSIIGDNIVRRS
jgi:hypothetical protein